MKLQNLRKSFGLVYLILFALLVSGCDGKKQDQLSEQCEKKMIEAEAFLKAWQTAIEALDVEKTVAFYTADAIYEDPAQIDRPFPAIMRGDEIKLLYINVYSLPEVSFEFISSYISADGSRATAEWIWRGKHPTSGADYAIRGVSLLEIQANKITREVIIYDTKYSPYE